VSPGQVCYVEAHGTGTVAGDPVEIAALANVLSSGRPPGSPCYLGSVKTNFGHTEAAAGIAGLIKTALVLKHRTVPANLHLRELNRAIAWNDYPFVLPQESARLTDNSEPAVAGVSAFGIAGTNAHAVLTEAPRRDHAEENTQHRPDTAWVLPLSARSPEALASLASAYISALAEQGAPSLYDVCYTAALHRTHHEHRLAVAARNSAGLRESLQAFLRGESSSVVWTGKAVPEPNCKTVFVCPGQGSQWVGMGRRLLRGEPVFSEWLQRCEQALWPYVDWSLHEQLHLDPDAPGYRLNEIDVIQPSLFAIQIALAALWRSWGVEPDAVVGHSMGETAAAFLAQALTLEDAARVICTRSLLLRRVSGKGAMAVVALTMEQAREALAGFEDRVSVAVSNSPRSTVVSGDPHALQEILQRLHDRNIFCRPVKVDVASHSPQMDVLTDDLLRELGGIQARETKLPMYSTVSAERIQGALLDARYWVRNLRCSVLFSNTVQKLAADGHTVFIELSPHPVLTSAIEEAVHDVGRKLHAIPSLDRDKDEQLSLRSSAGRLYSIGYPLDWARLFPFPATMVPLPAYPWQRQRFWLDTQPRQGKNGSALPQAHHGEDHPLLGIRLPAVASLPGSIVWQKETTGGLVSLSEAACVEMASAAAAAVFGPDLHRISRFAIDRGPGLPPGAGAQTQFILDTAPHRSASFQLFCRASGADANWTRYASGEIEPGEAKADWIYDLAWKHKSFERNTPEARVGHWLIFADRAGVGAAAAAAMT
jgi:myxalamid-type polyketide synthase MxaE and MxaD